ncbi:hypothetical protein [Ancylomarina longa]|uniref:HTH domain-containing protein n=1 Tax=Ancylomarina longa TaxID=2487017 RepID=A0A434AEX5_9BACT|nr:hypothetical protein [Ancylomarina longa]RUT72927.1 hypothetical protein DLK05_16030 [Ancylomarina longa]
MVKLLNIVDRLLIMDRLIRNKKTGNSEKFACVIGVSRSQLYNHLDEFKDLGVDIRYNRSLGSYEYCGELVPEIHEPIKIIKRKKQLVETNGGSFLKSPSLLDCLRLTLKDIYH